MNNLLKKWKYLFSACSSVECAGRRMNRSVLNKSTLIALRHDEYIYWKFVPCCTGSPLKMRLALIARWMGKRKTCLTDVLSAIKAESHYSFQHDY